MLNIAALQGVDTLIVGAFGCGRQGYPVNQAIAQFKSWIEAHPGAIENIVFAVPRVHFETFNKAFGEPEPQTRTEPEVKQVEEELFDPSDLPEGVTLR